MKLNKAGGNMYDWITNTGNVIKGVCPHGCEYCYMKRIGGGKQKPLHFDEKELSIKMPSGLFIFVGSSCDMWADAIPSEWITRILVHCAAYENKYLFQTKNPARFLQDPFSPIEVPLRLLDWVACTTIETNRMYPQMGNAPSPHARAEAMSRLAVTKYVTIEPIMDFDLGVMVELIRRCNPEQVNIGADSGRNNLPEPPYEKVLELVAELSKFTVISKKKNLARLETSK